MDLFTSTPVKSEGKLERFHVSSDKSDDDEGTISFNSREKLPNDDYYSYDDDDDDDSLDFQRRSMEADLAVTFQSRSLDSSLYTTYDDLSAFLSDSLEDTPTDNTRGFHDDNGTCESPTLVNSPSVYSSRQSFDAEALSLLNSKTVNRSFESIIYELERTVKKSGNLPENLDEDFRSAPLLQRSLSLDTLQLSFNRTDSTASPSNEHISRADENKLNTSGLNDDGILVQKDDTLPDSEPTEWTGYNVGLLAALDVGESGARRFDSIGITPAFGIVTNHESVAHYDREPPPSSSETGSSFTCATTTTTAAAAANDNFTTGESVVSSGDTERISFGIINECAPPPEICEISESGFTRTPAPYESATAGDPDRSNMESDTKQKGSHRGGQGESMATENDLMTVIEALRREATSWEEKYQELKQRRFSQSEEAKDFVEELKSRDAGDVVVEVQSRLREAESNLVDAREEIEELKEEIEDLKLELEEASDRVREGDLEEFRDLKHDLDQVTKECRILQYRLRKSDRKLEQVEQDKAELEAKLRIVLETPVSIPPATSDAVSGDANQSGSEKASASSNAGTSDEEDKAMEKEMANLKQQLKVAKDVSVRLHQELEMIEEKRARTEEDNQLLRNRLLDSESARKDLKRDLEKTKLEN